MRLGKVRTEEKIAAASASVNDDHQLSICHRLQQFSTTQKIFQNATDANNLPQRRILGEQAVGKLAEDPLRKIPLEAENVNLPLRESSSD